MRRRAARLGAVAAALVTLVACQLFAVRMPTRATAGESIVVEMDLRQALADGNPRPATHCARFPSSWTVTSTTYQRTVGGIASSGALGAALAGEATGLATALPLDGHTWVCRAGPSTNYANGDFGTARWTVTVQTPGSYEVMFVTTVGDGTAQVGARAYRRIVVDGLPDWRFDSRPTTLPTAQASWRAIKAISDLAFVAVDTDGNVHTTTDGGLTWLDNDVAPSADLLGLERLNNLFIAVGSPGAIYTTTAPLGTWTQRTSGTTQTINDICTDGTTVYVVGSSGYVATSVNGTTWFPSTVAGVGNVLACAAVPGAHAYAVTSSGHAFRLTHTGATPSVTDTTAVAGDELQAIAYVASPVPKLVAVSYQLAFERVLSAGPWTAVQTLGDFTPTRLRTAGDRVYAVGYLGLFASSPTDTIAWTRYGSGTSLLVNDIAVTGKVAVLPADGGGLLRVGIPDHYVEVETLALPRVAPNATAPVSVFAVRNSGRGVLFTSAPVAPPPFTASYNCDGALSELEECEVTVSIDTSTRGAFAGTLTLPSNAPVPRTVALSAIVGNDAMITATLDGTTPVTSVDFGSVAVGAPVTRTVLVRNAGDASLTIGAVAQLAVPSSPFAITDNACSGQIIAAGATCPITVRFQPFGQDGAAQAFDIVSTDAATPRLFVQLTGVGTPPADIRVDTTLTFPDTRVSDSVEATLLIRNVGRGPLEIRNLAVTEGGEEFAVVDANPFTVAAGESAERKIRFAPGTDGEKSGRLLVASNDPDAGERAVTMTAIALAESRGASADEGCAASTPEWVTLFAICAYAACRCGGLRHRRRVPSHA